MSITLEATNKGLATLAAKAAVRRQIKSGEVDVVDVMESTELTFTVAELLLAVRGVGHTKVERIVRAANVWPYDRFGGRYRHNSRFGRLLTDEERTRLVNVTRIFFMEQAAARPNGYHGINGRAT